MFQRLGEYVSACLQRADERRKAAAPETDDHTRSQPLDLEQRTLRRATSSLKPLSDLCSPVTLSRQRSRSCQRTFHRNRKGPTRPHQGGWKPYLRRARNAMKAAAIAANIAPPAIMNAAAAQNFALPASSSASRAPLRISSSSPAAASTLFNFKS